MTFCLRGPGKQITKYPDGLVSRKHWSPRLKWMPPLDCHCLLTVRIQCTVKDCDFKIQHHKPYNPKTEKNMLHKHAYRS
eukprot:UN10607